jgi:hypothetical protein
MYIYIHLIDVFLFITSTSTYFHYFNVSDDIHFVFITEKEYFIRKFEVIFTYAYVVINFHIQSYNDSVVVGMDSRTKYRFHEATYYFTL